MINKIVIIGTSGCGKTTLGKNLSKKLGIKLYDLDDSYWLSDWKIKDSHEFQNIVKDIVANENWIITGNYSSISEITWARADTVIWLDYSFYRCFTQGLKRSIRRIINKEKCCGDNHESFGRVFLSKDSILLWIINSYKRRKIEYNRMFNDSKDIKYIRFKTPEETENWLEKL